MKQAKALLLAEALESGQYLKAKGQLRRGNTNRMCCLGVACNLYAQANPDKVAHEFSPEEIFGEYRFLPEKIRDWFGFRTVHGKIHFNGNPTSLVEMNDGNYSHAQLAAVIRKHWKEL